MPRKSEWAEEVGERGEWQETDHRRCAVMYLRVSTNRQAEEGVSLAAQLSRMRAWCNAQDHRVMARHVEGEEVDHYSDALSGKRADNRPGLQAALDEVCRVRGILVVYSLSRLGRSTIDLLNIADRLRKAHADLCSLTESLDTSSAAGEVFFTIMAALAQFERRQLAERVTAAMAHCRRTNQRISRFIPFGYRLEGESLREVPAEQDAIRMAMELHNAGVSYGKVAARLNELSVKPARSETWQADNVKSIVRRFKRLTAGGQ